MPDTAITNWMIVLSALVGGFARTDCAVAAPLEEDFFVGVRSCMLKYSEDVSRRKGVVCFVRAIVVVKQ
jgi:hypothetical protein